MICALVRAGRKVGITALGHKVIRNLLRGGRPSGRDGAHGGALPAQGQRGLRSARPGDPRGHRQRRGARGADRRRGRRRRPARPGSGRARTCARRVDVLFVDEAGQISLANVLAVAQAARNLVLLGDPQQLEQPQQGSHPDGADVSALEHLLGGRETIPADRGLFLDETWRLHPAICAFTSELFYEDGCIRDPSSSARSCDGPTAFAGAGLWFVPGRAQRQPELLARGGRARSPAWSPSSLRPGVHWIDSKADRAPARARRHPGGRAATTPRSRALAARLAGRRGSAPSTSSRARRRRS